MYPLHMPKTERPARKTPETAPQQPASPWSQSDSRGHAPRANKVRRIATQAERRLIRTTFLAPAWPALFMWTSVFYLMAEVA